MGFGLLNSLDVLCRKGVFHDARVVSIGGEVEARVLRLSAAGKILGCEILMLTDRKDFGFLMQMVNGSHQVTTCKKVVLGVLLVIKKKF